MRARIARSIDRQPYRLSGFFSDNTGTTTLRIKENRWFVGADGWDIEVKGPRTTIRRGPRDIALALRVEPPYRIVVEELDMQYRGRYVRGKEGDTIQLSNNGVSWNSFKGFLLRNNNITMSL